MVSIDYTIYREAQDEDGDYALEREVVLTVTGTPNGWRVYPDTTITENEQLDIAEALQDALDGDYNDARCDNRRGC